MITEKIGSVRQSQILRNTDCVEEYQHELIFQLKGITIKQTEQVIKEVCNNIKEIEYLDENQELKVEFSKKEEKAFPIQFQYKTTEEGTVDVLMRVCSFHLDAKSLLLIKEKIFSEVAGLQSESSEAEIDFQGYLKWETICKVTNESNTILSPSVGEYLFLNESKGNKRVYKELKSTLNTTKLMTVAERYETDESSLLLTIFSSILKQFSTKEEVEIGVEITDNGVFEEFDAIIGPSNKIIPVRFTSNTFDFITTLGAALDQMDEAIDSYENLLDHFVPDVLFRHFYAGDIVAFNGVLAPCKLQLTVLQKTEGELDVSLYYDSNLIDKSFSKRLLSELESFLKGEWKSLELSYEDRIVVSEGASNSFSEEGVWSHFEKQCRENPNARAIVQGLKAWTYIEVQRKAVTIAEEIKRCLNGEQNKVVGIASGYSPSVPIAMLAILYSGNTYFSLNPNQSTDRIQYQLEHLGCSVVIVNDKTIEIPEELNSKYTWLNWDVDTKKETSSNYSCAEIAYVMFTSGTQGNPKAVPIPMEAMNNYLSWADGFYWANESQKNAYWLTSHLFDMALTTLFLPLYRGGAIVMAESDAIDMKIKEMLTNKSIDLIKLTPSHVDLLSEISNVMLDDKVIILGGEKVELRHRDFLLKHGKNTKIYNEYGPTEATVGCIVVELENSKPIKSIGRPIANFKVDIVDEKERSVGPWKKGQIALSGIGVMKGYCKNKTASEKVFITRGESQEKFYLTGDMGYSDAQGNIFYFGREDSQIKLDGYRIDKNEIVEALQKCESVNVAHVELLEEAKNQRLVGFVVGSLKKEELSKHLPEYMIPKEIIELPKIPLTANGKVDGKKLKEIWSQGMARVVVPPKTATEKRVATMFSEVLAVREIGRKDDFYDLGGNSLNSIQLMSKIASFYPERSLTIAQLFTHSSVEKLANLLDTRTSENDRFVPIAQGALDLTYVVLPGGHGLRDGFLRLRDRVPEGVALFGAKYLGEEVGSSPMSSMQALVDDLANCSFWEGKDVVLIGHSFGGAVAFELAKKIESKDEKVKEVIVLDLPTSQRIEEEFEVRYLLPLLPDLFPQYAAQLQTKSLEILIKQMKGEASDLECVVEHLIQLGIDQKEINTFQRLYDLAMANYRIIKEYVPTGKINAPITLIKAKETIYEDASLDWGWGEHSKNNVRIEIVEGDHGTMINDAFKTIFSKEHYII